MDTTTSIKHNLLARPRHSRGQLQIPSRDGSKANDSIGKSVPTTYQSIPKDTTINIQEHTKQPVKRVSNPNSHLKSYPSTSVSQQQVRKVPKPVITKQKTRTTLSHQLTKTAKQTDLLSRVVRQSNHQVTQTSKVSGNLFQKLFSYRNITATLVAIMLVSTGYVTVDTWLTNRQTTAQATSIGKAGSNPNISSEHAARSEGRDETPLPVNALSTYQVAPSKPRALYINKVDLKARILPVGVNTDSSMQAPNNIFDTGWYTGSSEPGELGAVTIDGHSSGATKFGAFGKLGNLEKGDVVTIERGDGKKIDYKVVAKQTVDKDKVDMHKFMLPYGQALRGANFITCTGDWTKDNSTMKQRVIVYTQQVS
ncbi:class F sortase [Candidatus Saccharibacteria bacterium]|jgi:sortase (surface protein transpeptidase)|nr:class F sortase [Candidatus Saccharibacteria bacterium]